MNVISSVEYGKKLANETDSEYRRKRNLYDKFLDMKLDKGMFIPCDSDGNILDEPKIRFDGGYDIDAMEQYQQAKERVLFKGFYYNSNIGKNGVKYEYVRNKNPHVFSFEQLEYNTVGSLLTGYKKQFEIKLTKSAIKMINGEDTASPVKEDFFKSGWYKDSYHSNKYLAYLDYENDIKYGFNTEGVWFKHNSPSDVSNVTEASYEEVQERIINFAIDKGFKGAISFCNNRLYCNSDVIMYEGSWNEYLLF